MDSHVIERARGHQAVIDRFIAVCRTDARIVAATLYGSHATGTADAHSDLDLGLIITDEDYAEFTAGREAFIRLLGEPLFVEDFGSSVAVLFILSDGAEVELSIGREGWLGHDHGGPYRVLLDKKGILAGAEFPRHAPSEQEQMEALRQQICWFWHDLSHFTTALARGHLWWACGQLEVLRRCCVNLARLHHDFADPDIGHDPYFKIELALPPEQLSPLETTFCPMESDALFAAAMAAVEFYRRVAPPLVQAHGIAYPAELDRLMVARLEQGREG
jgi:predicted nucleotidyltransferase